MGRYICVTRNDDDISDVTRDYDYGLHVTGRQKQRDEEMEKATTR